MFDVMIKKHLRAESLWLTGLAAVAILACGIFDRFENPMFVSILGAELAMPPILFIAGFFVAASFLTYGARAVLARFQKTPTNLIFLLFTGIAILVLFLLQGPWGLGALNDASIAYPPSPMPPSKPFAEPLARLRILQWVLIAVFLISALLTRRTFVQK